GDRWMSSASVLATATTLPPDMTPATKRAVRWLVAFLVVAVIVVGLRSRLAGVPEALRGVHPRWGLVALASLIVFGAYLVLVETGRIVLREFGGVLTFGEAARIW